MLSRGQNSRKSPRILKNFIYWQSPHVALRAMHALRYEAVEQFRYDPRRQLNATGLYQAARICP